MVRALLQHLISVVFPGLGHFLTNRPVRGAVLMSVIFYCFEGVLLSILIDDRAMADIVIRVCLGIALFIWIFAHVDLFRVRRLKKAATEEVFEEGIKAFTRGDLEEAENLMRKMLLGDPYDIQARIYLAITHIEKGALRAAERELNRCSRLDTKGVMAWETKTELQRLKDLKLAS